MKHLMTDKVVVPAATNLARYFVLALRMYSCVLIFGPEVEPMTCVSRTVPDDVYVPFPTTVRVFVFELRLFRFAAVIAELPVAVAFGDSESVKVPAFFDSHSTTR